MRKRIMVIDDSQVSLILMKSIIDELGQGHTVLLEEDSRMAVGRMKETRPDIVILDIMMPEVDGLSILRLMRDDKLLNNIPVIVLSALGDSKIETEALTLGASYYLRKPLNQNILVPIIRKLSNKSK